jgi:putative DNA primase/helicase
MLTAADSCLAHALAYLDAGYSIVPIKPDGSKKPDSKWKAYQQSRPSQHQVRKWFGVKDPPGIAIIAGAVSGNLELIDFDIDSKQLYPAWSEVVEAQARGLLARLCVHRSPRPGYHVWYRCDEPVPGSTDLAFAPGNPKACIETRGEGGYGLVPGGNPQAHETGTPYEHLFGPSLLELAPISAEDRALLIDTTRSFDRTAPAEKPTKTEERKTGEDGLRPGDDFDRRGPGWAEILEPHGWRAVHSRGETTYWCRPGKDGRRWSATTGHCRGEHGEPLLHVFTSSAHPFNQRKSYGKFRVHAILNHAGDLSAAAKQLAGQGYGDRQHARPVNRLAQAYAPSTNGKHAEPPKQPANGHGGRWCLDIEEGELGEDFGGRRWEVTVNTPSQLQAVAKDARSAKRVEQDAQDESTVMRIVDEMADEGQCHTKNGRPAAGFTLARKLSGIGGDRWERAVSRLVREGTVAKVDVLIEIVQGGKKPSTGLVRIEGDE